MKKRVLCLLLAVVISMSALMPAAALNYGGFKPVREYYDGLFHDVNASHWFASSVESAYNYGLITGRGGGVFDPGGYLTLGEAIKLVARLHSLYMSGDESFVEAAPFYAVYASYAEANGFGIPGADYTELSTRAQLAELIYSALPEESLAPINDVPDYAICDVVPEDGYSGAVYALYRAGVLSGSDRFGTFRPDDGITRAECAAVIERVASPQKRLSVNLPDTIPASELYKRCAGAVFMLELFNEQGDSIRTASGFFISDTGLAVTNEHVLTGAAHAIITLNGGEMYPVAGVNAVSAEYDLTVLSIDPDVSGLPYLKLADSDALKTGEAVYTLTSPLGLLNSMTSGVLSYESRDVDERNYFQFTAPISFGSGGGPVINARGQVLGVACSSFSAGEGLNLAVPCNLIKLLEIGECVALEDLLEE